MKNNSMDATSCRLKMLVEQSGLSVRAYAQKIGVCPQSLYKYLDGRQPSVELLQKILLSFPHVSAEWLLMGKGEIKRLDMDLLKGQIEEKDEQIRMLIQKIGT